MTNCVVKGFAAFASSRFAASRPRLVEAPFELRLGGARVAGRVDAEYEPEPGLWEVVDFKSGRRSEDPSRVVQLQAYAVAAHDVSFGPTGPGELRVTFAYFGDGPEEVTYTADEAWVADARLSLDSLTEGIASSEFDERPGPWCRNCDFLRFCGPGKELMAT